MSKNRIVIVAADKKVSQGYKSQLEGIFGAEIEIEQLSLDDVPEIFLGFDRGSSRRADGERSKAHSSAN